VPGTAAPGQPGNSAVVARRAAFGGAFSRLHDVRDGDQILVTTTQGQSVYEVETVETVTLGDTPEPGSYDPDAATATTTTAPADDEETEDDAEAEEAEEGTGGRGATTTTAPLLPDDDLTAEDLYGPSPDDRLTLVTSASRLPWASSKATVVVAVMDGQPFEPTPQNGRTPGDDGRSHDTAAAQLMLAGLAYGVAAVAAVLLYRRARPRSAYLLTAPPLLAATLLTADAVARLLPAWH